MSRFGLLTGAIVLLQMIACSSFTVIPMAGSTCTCTPLSQVRNAAVFFGTGTAADLQSLKTCFLLSATSNDAEEGVRGEDGGANNDLAAASDVSQEELLPPSKLSSASPPVSAGGENGDLSIFTVALSFLAFVSFWPLLAYLRANHYTFDVDTYMSLRNIFDSNNSDMMYGSLDNNELSILELPALSPAEQLVGVFFGPR